jgi:hypothetical protein
LRVQVIGELPVRVPVIEEAERVVEPLLVGIAPGAGLPRPHLPTTAVR